MSEPELPEITFPCDYPIKVVGDTRPGFHDQVYEIVAKHDPTMTTARVSQRTSRNGNYVSISFMLQAQDQEQLESLFAELKEIDAVRMVL